MDDLQVDLRWSLRLIGELDGQYNKLMEDIDSKLKQVQEKSVSDPCRQDTIRDIAQKSADARLIRLNCLDESKFMCESVEYVYNQIAAEIVKLKNPAWVRDSSNTKDDVLREANKVEMRLTRSNKRKSQEEEEEPVKDEEPRYCICNDVFYGEMIGCDDPKCKKEWYHLGCIGLKRAPKGDWVCPECTERREKEEQKKADNKQKQRRTSRRVSSRRR